VPDVSTQAAAKIPPSIRCPHCGDVVPAYARFCGNCGQVIGQSPPPTPSLDTQGSSGAGQQGPLPGKNAPLTVFISYSRDDSNFVRRLTADLQKEGIEPWVDQAGITPGTVDWEDALREAIRNAQALLLIASPHSRKSRYVKDELRIAEYYQLPVFPIWAEGKQWIESIPLGHGGMQYIDARHEAYAVGFKQVVVSLRGLARQARAEIGRRERRSSELELVEPRNPYKGLRPFRLEDSQDFFGRTKLVNELVQALKQSLDAANQQGPAARLLAVVGPSGSGKSSVVMAGLLPKLQQGALPGSDQWVYLDPIVPNTHPLASLAGVLWKRFPEKTLQAIQQDLEGDSAEDTLHRLTSLLPKRPDARVVVLLDQFEELFTQTIDERERRHFIDLLVTAATEPHGPVIVLLTLRADFYDRPMQYPELARLIQAHQRSVLPMDVEDMRSVIEGPAALPDVQVDFEGALVGDLLFEIRGQVGGLPLLQFTLDQLFQRRQGHLLTRAAYNEIGGVRGALAKHAESTYTELPSDVHRAMARVLFQRLIDPGATEQDTVRRRAALKELDLPDAAQTKIMQDTRDAFVAAHLLVTDEIGGVTTIEVSHEALIREWPRLADWLYEARDDIRLQRRIDNETAEWVRQQKPADMLYRGTVLDEAIVWAERSTPNAEEMAFIQASIEDRERQREAVRQQERAELEQQKREAALLRQSVRRRRYVIGWMGVASAVLLIGLIVSIVLGVLDAQANAQLAQKNAQLLKSIPAQVSSTADSGPGSLRDAIANANPGDTITFGNGLKGQTITLSSELVIDKNLAISGPGKEALTINGGGQTRVFHVMKGAVAAISGLTITNGLHDTSDATGGAGILNEGELLLDKSIISSNHAGNGGGITNAGSLILTNSTISGNRATKSDQSQGLGGGIFNFGELIVVNSAITGNMADTIGGGIASAGTFTISQSTVSGNTSTEGGGGIVNANSFTISQSTISDNTTTGGDGGGMLNGGPLTITNSTFSGNKAPNGSGGGLANESSGQADLLYCTFYDNTAASGSGSSLATDASSTMRLGASIVASDSPDSQPDVAGTFVLTHLDLIGNVSGATIKVTTGANAMNNAALLIKGQAVSIAPLANNGGPTKTRALLQSNPPNPAIDRIPADTKSADSICGNILNPATAFDQRGDPRPSPSNGACDLGAFEFQATS
jgi:energy-coupling factor transporter ATP-binding protein EcfA2